MSLLMITCYFGKLGQGKTYAMTLQVLNALNSGRVVYTNYQINWPGYDESVSPGFRMLDTLRIRKLQRFPKENLRIFRNFDDVLHMQDALIALDEGWIYFDSYKMSNFPLEFRMKVLQSRKDGLDICYTTQRPMQVHKTLRSMTNVFYECQLRTLFGFDVFKLIERDLTPSGEIQIDDNFVWHRNYRPKQYVYDAFDTMEKIGLGDVKQDYPQTPRHVFAVESEVELKPAKRPLRERMPSKLSSVASTGNTLDLRPSVADSGIRAKRVPEAARRA